MEAAVSLKALCAQSLIFTIEGHGGAESCWLKAQRPDAMLGLVMVTEREKHHREGQKLCLWL